MKNRVVRYFRAADKKLFTKDDYQAVLELTQERMKWLVDNAKVTFIEATEASKIELAYAHIDGVKVK